MIPPEKTTWNWWSFFMCPFKLVIGNLHWTKAGFSLWYFALFSSLISTFSWLFFLPPMLEKSQWVWRFILKLFFLWGLAGKNQESSELLELLAQVTKNSGTSNWGMDKFRWNLRKKFFLWGWWNLGYGCPWISGIIQDQLGWSLEHPGTGGTGWFGDPFPPKFYDSERYQCVILWDLSLSLFFRAQILPKIPLGDFIAAVVGAGSTWVRGRSLLGFGFLHKSQLLRNGSWSSFVSTELPHFHWHCPFLWALSLVHSSSPACPGWNLLSQFWQPWFKKPGVSRIRKSIPEYFWWVWNFAKQPQIGENSVFMV